jgi:HAD superfamily hydrolase (TIGR01509 family)
VALTGDADLPLNDRDCFQELWQKHALELPEAELVKLIQRKSAYYFSAIERKDVLFEGAADAIRAAASRGPVGIASGARRVEIRHILGAAGLLECFSTIVAAEDVQRGKPDPQPFQFAFNRLKESCADLEPQDCAAVEDSLGGIQSALSAGIPCLGVAHSYPRERLEKARPQWLIDSIADFADWLKKV